jgi:hypothetical protein
MENRMRKRKQKSRYRDQIDRMTIAEFCQRGCEENWDGMSEAELLDAAEFWDEAGKRCKDVGVLMAFTSTLCLKRVLKRRKQAPEIRLVVNNGAT